MKITEHDIFALKSLGYTEDEARFLYIVATHSGYFVPRQFTACTGLEPSFRFGHKIESRGHGCWRRYREMGRVYHLFSKTIYDQIGKRNLRNHRSHCSEFIKTRLVLLDFILANQQHDYFETEQQKVQYFCEGLGFPKKSLPAKSYNPSGNNTTLRYFVDRFPLFLDSTCSLSTPVLTFSFVDPGHSSVQAFATHLATYQPLLGQLSEFRFLYISSSKANFTKAYACFSKRTRSPLSRGISQELLHYFRLRKAWDLKKYALFANDQIEELNDRARQFQGERVEALYSAWSLDPSSVEREFASTEPDRKVDFVPYLVDGALSRGPRPGEAACEPETEGLTLGMYRAAFQSKNA
jgi:hypothetical protein